jgi:glycosyltransferase involved in cell wall biosynthesis
VSAPLDLAIVIPTFNERANVPTLIAKLDQALAGFTWEAVFVDDDSPDGNFLLNNALTYRDRRLRGVRAMIDGWVSFCAVCAVGAVANVGVAAFLHDARSGEWAASAAVGVLVGAVWNYALSSRFTRGRY